jgi:hypothetical protein
MWGISKSTRYTDASSPFIKFVDNKTQNAREDKSTRWLPNQDKRSDYENNKKSIYMRVSRPSGQRMDLAEVSGK